MDIAPVTKQKTINKIITANKNNEDDIVTVIENEMFCFNLGCRLVYHFPCINFLALFLGYLYIQI